MTCSRCGTEFRTQYGSRIRYKRLCLSCRNAVMYREKIKKQKEAEGWGSERWEPRSWIRLKKMMLQYYNMKKLF